MTEGKKWVGQSVRRFEDKRLLTGHGRYVDDITLTGLCHAAILRSPYPHARIRKVDPTEALKAPGVISVLTGEDVARMSRPFSVVSSGPVRYYSLAVDKARFVGEPVAVVVATDRYLAEDALELIEVDYEPLPAVVDPEKAAAPDAPLLHEELGSNVAVHRDIRYGDPDGAFAQADVMVSARLTFPKYGSTPMETYGVIADYDAVTEQLTIWSNLHGPFIMHPVVAIALGIPENKLRFIVPGDIGGGFGIKTSIFPYLALIGLASKKARRPVKWIEDRHEHLMASSSGTDRISYLEAAIKKDGTILAIRARIYDNVGGYIRSPEPGCVFRALGNFLGPYRIQHLHLDAYVVMTNKSPTGPNRGYGCQQLYFGQERLVDLVAERLGMDPAEVRRRNLIQPEEFPYRTPTGGIYDSGDYPAAFQKALDMADYPRLRQEQERARQEGRLYGIGIAIAVDPSVSNMGYVTTGIDPSIRARKDYAPKSGAAETATIKMDPLGRATVAINSAPQGQGHETIVAQIVADELGIKPEEVSVLSEFDTFTRVWNVSSGSYSSRFASVGTSAVAMAARRLKEKILQIAAHQLEVGTDDLVLAEGRVYVRGSPERGLSLRHVAGIAHWNPQALPPSLEPGLQAIATYNFPYADAPNEYDRVNSSNTYGFIAEVAAVEVDRETAEISILKYVTVHDAGTIINPLLVEGQIYGGVLHGLGGALYEEMAYDDDGQFLTGSFMDYLCPTAVEAPELEIGHVETPSPLTLLGSKGCGESSTMTAPALIANAVADALKPLGITITGLPVTPDRLWRMMQAAKGGS